MNNNRTNSRLSKVLLTLTVVVCFTAPGVVHAKRHKVKDQSVISPVVIAKENPDEISHYSYTLEDLGALYPIDLHTVDGRRSLNFSLRNDDVITAAKLKLKYAWSPALIPELSHLRVLLNDEQMGSLPMPRENSTGHENDVALDPSLFIDFNKLTLNMIAHYTRDCEDPVHSTLWSNVSNQSRLDLTVRHLKLSNDLALLPAPFFDKLDNTKLELPIVFPAQPNSDVLHAAGVVASWFGALSNYRGAQFPALLNTLPKGNGIVIVMGSNPPAGLGLPPISGASLAVVDNPLNAYAKLLVVMGRDAKELDIAAQALTLGTATLAGSYVNVSQMKDIPQRKPYDAPRWMPTDRPVQFGELSRPEALQVAGLSPDSIKINFNIPPDIFPWRSKGVPVNLHYRYTVRPVPDRSTLNVNMNRLFVQALPLASVPDKLHKNLNLPFIEDGKAISNDLVLIPHQNIYGRNQMQLEYFFDYTKQGVCKDVFLNNERGVIDEKTTIDFSSFPHYTALPNLSFFVNDGYPYSRMADLSGTAVVMPDNATLSEVGTYLTVMGRMGRATGYPVIRHSLITAASVEANADKDLILIGTAANQPLLTRWADNMPPLLEKGNHSLRLPGTFERLLFRWENIDFKDAMQRAGDLISKGNGEIGALVAFESPLKSGRSVVVFTGDNDAQINELAVSMADAKISPNFKGDMVLQSGKRLEGFQMGPSYYVGSLPIITSLLWHLFRQPLWLIPLIVVAALLVAAVVFRFLRRRVAKRLA